MNRRGFMGSILALAAAPAIVRADALMRIVPRYASGGILVPDPTLDFIDLLRNHSVMEKMMRVRVPIISGGLVAAWVPSREAPAERPTFGYREVLISRDLVRDPSPAAQAAVRRLIRGDV